MPASSNIVGDKRPFLERLMQEVGEVYTEEAKKIAQKHKDEMCVELDKLATDLVLKAGFSIQSRLQMEDLSDRIIITYAKEK